MIAEALDDSLDAYEELRPHLQGLLIANVASLNPELGIVRLGAYPPPELAERQRLAAEKALAEKRDCAQVGVGVGVGGRPNLVITETRDF